MPTDVNERHAMSRIRFLAVIAIVGTIAMLARGRLGSTEIDE